MNQSIVFDRVRQYIDGHATTFDPADAEALYALCIHLQAERNDLKRRNTVLVKALGDYGVKLAVLKKQALASMSPALQLAREALSTTIQYMHNGYDWNADPLNLTLKQGDAFKAIDAALDSASPPSAPSVEEAHG